MTIERTAWHLLLQIKQLEFSLIPVLGPVESQKLRVKLDFLEPCLVDLALHAKRLEYCDRLVFTLHADAIELAEYDVRHRVFGALADYDISAVFLCDPLKPGG